MADELKPCPFCNAGETQITENRMAPRIDGTSTLISADLRHWCTPGEDNYVRATFHIRARDEEQAIAAWNRRAPDRLRAALAAYEEE